MTSNGRHNGGTLYLILTQVASRALTFLGNQILLRFLSPTLLGIAVQLELLSVTVLYFARESLRVALQRRPADSRSDNASPSKRSRLSEEHQAAVNVAYLAICLGLVVSIPTCIWYLRCADPELLASHNFPLAFRLYATATIIELVAEPFFIVIQQHSLYSSRAHAETNAAIARCLVACATAYTTHCPGQPPSVTPFACGQLAYSTTLFLLYYSAARGAASTSCFSLTPRPLTNHPSSTTLSLFPNSLLTLSFTLYAQSIFKLFLTQGDHLILSLLTTLASQGAFALASNYGGLLARLVFQPVEEASRNIFGRLLSSRPPEKANIKKPLDHLSLTLRTYFVLSLPILTLLPPLLPHLVPIALAPTWRTPSTTLLLQTYVFYLPTMAINGILDAFVTSVATPKQLRTQSLWMALFTAVYGASAWFFMRHLGCGSEGVVYANVVGMVLRIVWGGWFVTCWIAQLSQSSRTKGEAKTEGEKSLVRNFLRDCLPTSAVVAATIAAGIALQTTIGKKEQLQWPADAQKIGLAVVFLVPTFIISEQDLLLTLLTNILPERLARKVPFVGSHLKCGPPDASADKKEL